MWLPSTQQHPSSSTQVCTWKHGKITLSSNQILNPPSDSILITSQPFNESTHIKGWNDRVIIIESSQQNKCMETVENVCEQLMKLGANRDTVVYVRGGGMLLDLVGFACGIYMRGIKNVIFVPTTLLSIVDATVGGKNGINWRGAKNILGTIKHSSEIKISLHYLKTLSDREFANGLAQSIKMAITHSSKLFELFEQPNVTLQKIRQDQNLLFQIIKQSLTIKVNVVQNDQFDNSGRQWLNFGHTVGHAFELSSEGRQYKHGECVSIGILEEMKIGQLFGHRVQEYEKVIKRITKVLLKIGLPVCLPLNVNPYEMIALMGLDKKNVSSNLIEMTLIDQIGKRKQKTSSITTKQLYQYYLKNEYVELCSQTHSHDELKERIMDNNRLWLQSNRFPGSKSLSIRYLFLGALYYIKNNSQVTLTNFLQSEDTACLKQSLKALGFHFEQNMEQKKIKIVGYTSKASGTFFVGNSGLTARFILILCSYLPGRWKIQCHKRMSERPNRQIFDICSKHFDCQFEWLQQKNCFPVVIVSKGGNKDVKNIEVASQQSSQFISSVMLNSYLWEATTKISIQAVQLVSQSYIQMTAKCLQKFGCKITAVKENNRTTFQVIKNYEKKDKQIAIELDLSSFSYPYALALIIGAPLPHVSVQSTQGDLLFYQYCQSLIKGTISNKLDFTQCTDTFMTMAAILATNNENRFNLNSEKIEIFGISNQRVKQSNRIQLIRQNLSKIGYVVEQTADGIVFPVPPKLKTFRNGDVIVFETAGDHRLAMSMSLLSLHLSMLYPNVSFIIDDKDAVNKTFPNFWTYLEASGIKFETKKSLMPPNLSLNQQIVHKVQLKKCAPLSSKFEIIMGNRGCGKSTVSKSIAKLNKQLLIDTDEQIIKTIKQNYSSDSIDSIGAFVDKFGWDQFRRLEKQQLSKIFSSGFISEEGRSVIVATGGGIVDWKDSVDLLANMRNARKIYLQKSYEDLKIDIHQNRPFLPNFSQVFNKRSSKYQDLADHIVTGATHSSKTNYSRSEFQERSNSFMLADCLKIIGNKSNKLQPGYIFCVPSAYDANNQIINLESQLLEDFSFERSQNKDDRLAGIQVRVDLIAKRILNEHEMENGELLRKCRQIISEIRVCNKKVSQSLPFILTLRSKEQYGEFELKQEQNESEEYLKWMTALQKVPVEFIDFEYSRYKTKSPHFENKFGNINYIISYHGPSSQTVSQMMAFHNHNKTKSSDLLKICFNGSDYLWQKNQQMWRKNSDICINLNNPLSRLSNRFKMVISETDNSQMIKIPKRTQLKMLGSLARFFK